MLDVIGRFPPCGFQMQVIWYTYMYMYMYMCICTYMYIWEYTCMHMVSH